MRFGLVTIVVGVILLTVLAAGPSAAAGRDSALRATARLNAKEEVPKRAVGAAAASGRFSAILKKTKKGYRLSWTLTFSRLTGNATSAYIHRGKRGKFGAALFFLCAPCKSGARGSNYASPWEADLMRTGATYVNVRTKKNPAGEIRGQIRIIS